MSSVFRLGIISHSGRDFSVQEPLTRAWTIFEASKREIKGGGALESYPTSSSPFADMKSSGLSAFVALALVLSTSAAPTPSHAAVEENAANAEDAYLPLPGYRPAFVRPFYRPLHRPPSPVARVANDALGVASDVASTAGNIVGSVLHGILRRDTEDEDFILPGLARLNILLHNKLSGAAAPLLKTVTDAAAAATAPVSGVAKVADDLTTREVDAAMIKKRPRRVPHTDTTGAEATEAAPPFDANELSYRRDLAVLPAFLQTLQQNPALLKALSARLAAKAAPVADVADAVTRREVDSSQVSSVKKKGKRISHPPPAAADAPPATDADAALTEDAALTGRDIEFNPALLQALQRNPRLAEALKQRLAQKTGSIPV
ncbi:hypothetical protein CVT26_014227 [Gymnopilus dilepis]|uniref:Uncharacterized protein n=1 Tax=Gymnopilus dilepis TaxID=231916 RepID=A0A409VXC9_9AGAR|nr:hypothetical protein CVT26_014227 [Gymnopilus dilepis]